MFIFIFENLKDLEQAGLQVFYIYKGFLQEKIRIFSWQANSFCWKAITYWGKKTSLMGNWPSIKN